jgi:hypothetical protein
VSALTLTNNKIETRKKTSLEETIAMLVCEMKTIGSRKTLKMVFCKQVFV